MTEPLLVDEEGSTALLLGNEAIVRGALEAGVKFVAGYPGTPSSEITDAFARIGAERRVVFEYSVNEKIALEVAFAASLAGARALCAMKHVGLSYAGDPLATIPYVGTVAGLVIVSAGDPSCRTSSNEQDQRYLGPMLHLPVLDPSTPQEALEMTRAAFEISEASKLPILLRPTTRVCHVRSVVRLGRLREPEVTGFSRAAKRFVPIPPNARRMRGEIDERMRIVRTMIEASRFVRRKGDARQAIVASGAAAATTEDLLREEGLEGAFSLLTVGAIHPLPEEPILALLSSVDRVLVVEELSPYLEDAIAALVAKHKLPVEILGKRTGHLPTPFEYTPQVIARGIRSVFGVGSEPKKTIAAPTVPERNPILCAGCGHRAAFYAARAAFGDDTLFFNDIGCYTLGYDQPLDATDALLCMGAGLTLAAGVSRVTGKRTVGFIGDGTFLHSGIPALLDAVKERVSMVAVILDNEVTAMTGFQDSPGVHLEGPDNRPVREFSLEGVVRSLGVRDVQRADPNDLRATINAFERARDSEGVSVVILERACQVYLARVAPNAKPQEKFAIDHEACRHCGREALGGRCDVPETPGLMQHMTRNRSLEMRGQGKEGERPAIAPCAARCPLFLCVQGYAGHIAAGEYVHAFQHVIERVPLPDAVCRVCHRPCERVCVRGEVDEPIAINDLKRFVVEWTNESNIAYRPAREVDHDRHVAIVGAGPAGLAAAHELRLRGYRVTLYDARDAPGGLLRSGIPRFRLPRKDLERDVARVLELGVAFVGGRSLGRDLSIETLLAQHDAVLVAVGAWRPLSLKIPGETGEGLPRVQPGLRYLEDVELGRAERLRDRTVVVGGGNAAIDVARTARRSGAERVTIVCLETRAQMPVLEDELRAAEVEGIEVVTEHRVVRIERGKRPSVIAIDSRGVEVTLDADEVIVAIGQAPDEFLGASDVALDRDGDGTLRIVRETGRTSNPRVFAAGDVVGAERTVTHAIACGLRAAWGIDRSLRGEALADRRMPPPLGGTIPVSGYTWAQRTDRDRRRPAPERSIEERAQSFSEVHGRMSEQDARAEAARCMSCGLCGNCRSCVDVFGCPAFHFEGSLLEIDRDVCIGCGVCATMCPDDAARPSVKS